ncbi:hypothetical protein [Actinoplanes sp. NPDC049265]|uniref:hypothetical protein n=1 Tax=Actinoplanes sp. NPDC049265 TaxID=3363902 RepID=UPI00371F7088
MVVGWARLVVPAQPRQKITAYAVGSLITLLRDRAFRPALARQRFTPHGGPAA